MTTPRKPQIKMVTFNPATRRYEDVPPTRNISAAELIPMFWVASAGRWVTIPGTRAADVYDKWKKTR